MGDASDCKDEDANEAKNRFFRLLGYNFILAAKNVSTDLVAGSIQGAALFFHFKSSSHFFYRKDLIMS